MENSTLKRSFFMRKLSMVKTKLFQCSRGLPEIFVLASITTKMKKIHFQSSQLFLLYVLVPIYFVYVIFFNLDTLILCSTFLD